MSNQTLTREEFNRQALVQLNNIFDDAFLYHDRASCTMFALALIEAMIDDWRDNAWPAEEAINQVKSHYISDRRGKRAPQAVEYATLNAIYTDILEPAQANPVNSKHGEFMSAVEWLINHGQQGSFAALKNAYGFVALYTDDLAQFETEMRRQLIDAPESV